jgi:antitoxin YefM
MLTNLTAVAELRFGSGHEPVVIVSLDDYQSLKEAAYLLRSPENARRLLGSIDRLESGGGLVRELAE